MTNEQLGKRIGVTHSMASRLRSGSRLPGIDTLQNIKAAFPKSNWDELMAAREKGAAQFAAHLEQLINEDERQTV